MSHSLTTPLVKVVGDDALLTCVVQNQQNYTLMWKRDSKEKIGTKILTANTERVTGDPRVSIIHEEGGEVRPEHHVWGDHDQCTMANFEQTGGHIHT